MRMFLKTLFHLKFVQCNKCIKQLQLTIPLAINEYRSRYHLEHKSVPEKVIMREKGQTVLCNLFSAEIERLRNENEDKTKTQSFNQYSGNETKIRRQNIPNQFNRVSSSCLRSHFVISPIPQHDQRNFTGDPTRIQHFPWFILCCSDYPT